jgi:hypothetical protein
VVATVKTRNKAGDPVDVDLNGQKQWLNFGQMIGDFSKVPPLVLCRFPLITLTVSSRVRAGNPTGKEVG